MAKAPKKKKAATRKPVVDDEETRELVVIPDSEFGDLDAQVAVKEKAADEAAAAEAAKHAPPPRPKGAPPPEEVRSEHVTRHGTVYRLKNPVKLSRGGFTRKIFVPHPGHESHLRPADKDYADPQRW